MNILLIEDNENIIKGLEYSFSKENIPIKSCTNIKDAEEYLNRERPDAIILDISLPDGNGIDFFKRKIIDTGIPTLVLTASDSEEEIVEALNSGCEDYMTKPFSTKELIARINRITNRVRKNAVVVSGDIEFDLEAMQVKKNGIVVNVTGLELKILELLFMNINRVVKRDTILEHIWEWTGNDVDDHTLTVYLKRIREKIGDDIITTVKKVGYRIDGK